MMNCGSKPVLTDAVDSGLAQRIKMRISPVLIYTLIASLGGFIFGFDATVISGTLNFVVNEFQLSPMQQGLVVGAPTLGAIIATLTGGIICDAIGRRNFLIIIAFLYSVSAVASAFAPSYNFLVAARFIGGLAFCSLMIAPMYIAEISRAEERGRMVSINQLNIMLGFSVAYFSNYYILQWAQTASDWGTMIGIQEHTWRWMLGIEAFPAILWFGLLFLIPRSPRWLLQKGRETEARLSLAKLGLTRNASHEVCAPVLYEMRSESSPGSDKMQSGLADRIKFLFSNKMRFAIVIGVIIGITQQVTGINAVSFYAPTIFEQSGVGTNAAFAQAIWIGIINIIFTLLAMSLIDKLGRKPLLIIGLSGVFLSMSLCGYGFYKASYRLDDSHISILQNKHQNLQLAPLKELQSREFDSDVVFKASVIKQIGTENFNKIQSDLLQLATNMDAKLILAGILGFMASFAISLGPVMWVMFSEIFPNHVRGLAVSFVGVINSIASFAVQFMFPWELLNIGAALTFFIYGIFALVGLLLVWRLFPETKGKSLEQLELELGTGK